MSNPRGNLNVRAEADPAGTLVTVAGEVDLNTSPQLRDALLDVVGRGGGRIIIDLSSVGYMDSSGVGTIVEAKRRADRDGAKLVLSGLQERVLSVFQITQLDRFFTIAESLDDAREA